MWPDNHLNLLEIKIAKFFYFFLVMYGIALGSYYTYSLCK